MIYNQIEKEEKRIAIRIEYVRKKLEIFPEGKLVCSKNGNTTYKWYNSDGCNKVYIPKKEQYLAEQLAQKRYWTCVLEDLLQEQKAVSAYLKKSPQRNRKVEQLLEDEGCKELLGTSFMTKEQSLVDWQQADYEKNPNYPEHLKHKTIAGHYVRSKSEAMITSYLYTNQIPYRYECALTLEGVTIYPDFTIRHPKTGEVYYWEHFGKMDDEKYVRKTCRKFQIYTSNGIIPTIHLITTYETKDRPLDMGTIEETIEHYFA